MKKADYKNIFCVMTMEKDPSPENFLLKNRDACKITQNEGALVFCTGDENIQKTSIKKIHIEDYFLLKVPFKEKYNKLSEKTYKCIDFIVKNFNFNYVLKCDDNKPIYYDLLKLDTASEDFFGMSANKARKDKRGRPIIKNLYRGLARGKTRNFKRWAMKRNLKINESYYDEWAWYANWKPYALSYKFAKVFSEFGESYTNLYNKHLAGCEDHMVGKIFKDLKIAYNLKG